MDQQLSERGLSLRPFDPEVFARVWSRVMPDQALSPIQPAPPAGGAHGPAPRRSGVGPPAGPAGRRPGLPPAGLPRRRPAAAAPPPVRRLFSHHRPALCSQGAGAAPSGPLSSALRTLFQQAQQCAAQAAVLARTVSDDPCLSRLLEDIQDEAQSHAAQIRVLLEELL